MIDIVEKIDAEIARLQMARTALAGAGTSTRRDSLSSKEIRAALKATVGVVKAAPKRTMSTAGRARIAAAQKARWAKAKKAVKAPAAAKKLAAKK